MNTNENSGSCENSQSIHVYSEIAPLKKVLLFRPGNELINLMPEYLDRLLFDDIPFMEVAQQEHDDFADVLRQAGSEVVYLDDLVAESLINEKILDKFILEFISEAGIQGEKRTELIQSHFKEMPLKDMIRSMIAGVRKSDIKEYSRKNLVDYLEDDYPFLIDPMPNLYFTRDPFACAGNGVSIHRMSTVTRNRETLFAEYIFKYHPDYCHIPAWYERGPSSGFSADYAGCEAISGTCDSTIEGGDILILNDKTIAIGISQRTQPYAIEQYAKNILDPINKSGFEKVIAIDIPKSRSFMHLDTVFTMVDYDKFTVHHQLSEHMNFFVIEMSDNKKLVITEIHEDLKNMLAEQLGLSDVTIIECGGGHPVDAAREQWNDGSNTLAVSPGEVIVYSRNTTTNKILQEYGIKTHIIPSCELSRGRGGPRCMSMPLIRE